MIVSDTATKVICDLGRATKPRWHPPSSLGCHIGMVNRPRVGAEEMIHGFRRSNVKMHLAPDTSDYGSSDRMTTWRSRPLRFKLGYYRNVIRAFARREISVRSLYRGLRLAHCTVALAPRVSGSGMVYVCSAWIAHLEELVGGLSVQQLKTDTSCRQPIGPGVSAESAVNKKGK